MEDAVLYEGLGLDFDLGQRALGQINAQDLVGSLLGFYHSHEVVLLLVEICLNDFSIEKSY